MTTDDIDRFDEKFWDSIYNTSYASLINLIEASRTFSELKAKINDVRKKLFFLIFRNWLPDIEKRPRVCTGQ